MTLNNAKIPIAVSKRTNGDLPADIVTTQQFMLLQPLYYHHMLPTESSRFNINAVVRPQAMIAPTFGRCRLNLRAFYVPYRLVFPNWYSFSNQTIASNQQYSAIVSSPPYFTANDLITLFTSSSYQLTSVITTGTPDFIINNTMYLFTQLGRYFYKVLYMLGYDLVGKTSGDTTFVFNAFALLAYARCYCDWYANSQYLNSADYLALQRYFAYNQPTSALHLTDADLYKVLLFVRPAVYNTNGYFEAAWDKPSSPNNYQYPTPVFTDIDDNHTTNIRIDSAGTPVMRQSSASNSTIGTQYIHDALKKLTDLQRRHAISGSRDIDRFLASYGIVNEALKLQRSIYVGYQSIDIDIQSVFATANGSATLPNGSYNSVVGDYAGAGLGRGVKDWDFQADEEGIFIVISTIQPSGGYYQGYDRINRRFAREDWFTEEYDSLAVQSIEKGEVYISKDFDTFSSDANDYSGHFAFTSRYGEQKRSINRVSGDIALPSITAGGDSWHLMREFNDLYFNNSVANIVHDEDFCRGTDALQYDRLFYYVGTDKDHRDPFNVFAHVECKNHAPYSSLFDNYEFDSNGKDVTLDVNGPKLN